MDEERYVEELRRRLSPWRFAHSLRVAETARRLADKHGLDGGRAWLAGLLHDYAREVPLAEMRRLARERGLEGVAAEPSVELLHGLVGSTLVRDELGVVDEEVLRAIARHTTGEAGMAGLELSVFVGDYAEPERTFAGVEEVRALAEASLEAAALRAVEQTVAHLSAAGRLVDERSLRALRDLRARVKEGL